MPSTLRSRTLRLASELSASDPLRKRLISIVATDWSDPVFTEAVDALRPFVPKIKGWLQAKTRISKWNAEGPGPVMDLRGNGAIARFAGKEGMAWWDVEVMLLDGDDVYVVAMPPRQQYPGWKSDRPVAHGKLRDLSNLDSLLGYAGKPFELILRGRR